MDKRLNAICGDVIEELCKLENDSVDLIVTDPPYNLNKDYGTSQDKLEFKTRWNNICFYGYEIYLIHIHNFRTRIGDDI